MHYAIFEWLPNTLEWKVKFYTHNFDEFQTWAEKYPRPEYKHMVDVCYLESHEVYEDLKAFQKRTQK